MEQFKKQYEDGWGDVGGVCEDPWGDVGGVCGDLC